MLLDVHADPDHNRSVFTLAAEEGELVESLLAGIAAAVERIDLREHVGVHPRVGAADVVPLVPLAPEDDGAREVRGRALAGALESARSSGSRSSSTARSEAAGGPRSSGAAGSTSSGDASTRASSCRTTGLGESIPRSGAVLVGARHALVAYNVDLATDDVGSRARSPRPSASRAAGCPACRRSGSACPSSGRVQVSMNVIDVERAPLHEVVERVRAEAAARGVEVSGGELVGLVPERVVARPRAPGAELPGVDESQVLERRAPF